MLSQNKTTRLLSFAAFGLALSVALGAFGAHGLAKVLSATKLDVFKTANLYLAIHSLGLILVLLLKNTTKFRIYNSGIYMLTLGTWIFCIALYLASFSELQDLSGLKKAGLIAPVGGSLIVIAWTIIAFGLFKSTEK